MHAAMNMRIRAAGSVRAATFALLALLVACAAFHTKALADLHASDQRRSDRARLEESPAAEYSFKPAGSADEALIFTPPGCLKLR